jgi:hypothetical protein
MSEFLTSNTSNKLPVFAILLLLGLFTVGFGLWFFFRPVAWGSAVFWIGCAVMAIPSYVAIESFGTLGLSNKWIKHLPRLLRIVCGVIWILLGLVIISLMITFLSSFIGSEITIAS